MADKKKVILLSGYAGSGKDTVGNILVNRYGYKRFAFADKLKSFVAAKYNFDAALTTTQDGKKKIIQDGLSVRDLLIYEAQRSKESYPDIWADILVDEISTSSADKIVVTDLRYLNEYAIIKERFSNVITCRVINNRVTISNDPSEHQLDYFNFDKFIFNNSSLSNLLSEVENVLYNKM